MLLKTEKKLLFKSNYKRVLMKKSNISYSEQMQTEGIELIFGVKGLKVHSKICLIERLEEGKVKRYGFISTGNFNENWLKYIPMLLYSQVRMKFKRCG